MVDEKKNFGMSGEQIFHALEKGIEEAPGNTELILKFSVMQMQWLHARVLSCLCECLGYNAENMLAACQGLNAPFGQPYYIESMQKWGLVDEKGESII